MTAASSINLPTYSLESLSRLSLEELDRLYRQARLPASLQVLDGRHEGRILAMSHLEQPPFSLLLNRFAGSRAFPWAGKNFASSGEWQGEGVNRLRFGTQFRAFPFLTARDKSALDGAPCVKIDYDTAGNPWPVSQLRDELRELEPGLFLGPGLWRTHGTVRLLLYFAVDTRV